MQQPMIVFLRKHSEVGLVLIVLLLIVGFTASSDGIWLSNANMGEVLRVTAVLAIMAFGEALVITAGEIDISVGSVFGITGIIYVGVVAEIGILPAILVALLAAVIIGILNGFVVAYFRIPSLIVTLGSLFIFRGLAYAIFENSASFAVDSTLRANPVYRFFGDSVIFGVNNALIWAIAILLFLNYVLFLTPIGNRLMAVGGNAESAHSRGVNVLYTRWGAFIASAFFAGLAGILEASNLAFVDGSFGRQRELQTIAAAVMGGCVLAGGRSSLLGTLLGAFILSGIQSYLVIKAIQPQWFILLLGLIVVLVSLGERGLTHFLTRRTAQPLKAPETTLPQSISSELGELK
jgi:ribose transport system permease protein